MSYAVRALAALQQTATTLTAAGVRTSLERGEVNPPGGFLMAQTAEDFTLDGTARLRVHLYLIAPDTGDVSASRLLWGLLDKALTVVDPDEQVDTSYGFVLPHNPQVPLPAFRLPFDLDI